MIIRRLEALFSFKINPSQFNQASRAIDDFAENANTAMAALAGHFAVQAIKDFADSTTEAMANTGRMAGMLGISTQSLEELRYAAAKSGVSIDTLDDSMKELQIRAVDAKSGTGEAAEAFQALGLKTTDSAGKIREPLELLDEVADKLRKLPTQSERIWTVDAIFGDQGAEMIKILEGGSKGLAKMRHEAQELGYTLDDSSVESALNFRHAVTGLQASLNGIAKTVLKSLLPSLTDFAQKSASFWKNIGQSFVDLNNNTSVLRTTFIALGLVLSALAAKTLIAFAPMIAIGALVAVAALLIDDLWTAFSGGESVSKRVFQVIGKWLSSLQGLTIQIAGGIWNFLPARLQDNLQKAFDIYKNFCNNFAAIMNTVFKRVFGYILEAFSQAIQEIKKALQNIYIFVIFLFKNIAPFLARILVTAFDEVFASIKEAILSIKNLIADIVPDFVKKGFSSALDYVGSIGSHHDNKSLKSYFIPQTASNHVENHNNQNVSISVNTQSSANPQEIGLEIQKTVRKELEREREIAFMGVHHYAY